MVLLLLAACSGPKAPPEPAARPATATCTLLTVNDTYRIEENADGSGGMARVRALREDLEADSDVLLLHAGDFLYPSLLSRTYDGAQVIEVFNALDGKPEANDPRMFVVFGNHEFDAGKAEDAAGLVQRIADSQFTWLGTNVKFRADAGFPDRASGNLSDLVVVPCGGLNVGIFGVTTDKASSAYVDRFVVPVAAARSAASQLRSAGADVVVALTHQPAAADTALLQALGADGPDFVVGGHEHNHLQIDVDGRSVYKADADAASAWRIVLAPGGAGVTRDAKLLSLSAARREDAAVAALVAARLKRHDEEYCIAKARKPGCLADEVGTSTVPLVAAELDIRRFETNLGNWVADRARAAFPDAQVAFVNSGALRLNRDLAAGPVTRRDVEELFAYPMPLVRVEIDGAALEQAVARAVEEWTGNGHFLQVSGFAWAHDAEAGTASRLTLLATGTRIAPTDKLVAAVPYFLVDPTKDRDGYTMLPAVAAVPEGAPDLVQLVYTALAAGPVAPAVEGRICNPERSGPCLAAE